jgi:CDP-4-dehydro-6-deoxyglucose reductase
LAGQAVEVGVGGVGGRYAVASCPCEDRHIEVHVARRPDDAFSEIVFEQLKPNDSVDVEGPYGDFVLDEDSPRPVIFLAFGAGFAPIKSLVQHAMSLEFSESLDLHWVADEAGHYQDNLCRAWTDALDNFSYFPHVQSDDLDEVLTTVVAGYPDLQRFDVYAAGPRAALERARDRFVKRALPQDRWFAGATDA